MFRIRIWMWMLRMLKLLLLLQADFAARRAGAAGERTVDAVAAAVDRRGHRHVEQQRFGRLLAQGRLGRLPAEAADLRAAVDVDQPRDAAHSVLVGIVGPGGNAVETDADAWDQLVAQAARGLAAGGYLVVRSMLKEFLGSEEAGLFVRESKVSGDASPLCPVIWVGRKR